MYTPYFPFVPAEQCCWYHQIRGHPLNKSEEADLEADARLISGYLPQRALSKIRRAI